MKIDYLNKRYSKNISTNKKINKYNYKTNKIIIKLFLIKNGFLHYSR